MTNPIAALIEMFRPRKAEDRPVGPARPPIGHSGGGDSVDFSAALRRIITEHQPILAGNIDIIGLQKVRQHFGSSWGRLQSQIHLVTGRIIEKSLTPADLYTRYGDLEYLIVFARLGKEAAQLKCAKIAQDVYTSLIGIEGLKDVEIKSVVEVLDGNIIAESLSVEECVQNAAATVKAEEVRAGERAGRDTEFPSLGASRDDVIGDLDWLDDIEFVFRPIWDVKREVVSTFHSVARRVTAVEELYGDAALPDELTKFEKARFDEKILSTTLVTLDELIANRSQFLVVISIHYTTLTDPALKADYLRWRQRVPSKLLKYVKFEIVGLPEGVSFARLNELSVALQPLPHGLILHARLGSGDISQLHQTGISAVSVNIAHDRRAERLIIKDLNDFAERAEKQGLASYLHGVRSTSLGLAAITAGVGYISGDRVQSATDFPQHLYRYDWHKFYKEFFALAAGPQAAGGFSHRPRGKRKMSG